MSKLVNKQMRDALTKMAGEGLDPPYPFVPDNPSRGYCLICSAAYIQYRAAPEARMFLIPAHEISKTEPLNQIFVREGEDIVDLTADQFTPNELARVRRLYWDRELKPVRSTPRRLRTAIDNFARLMGWMHV
jgi:hypothetical protein